MTKFIDQIVMLRQSGIYALVNDNKKIALICGSRNMLQHINNLLSNLDTLEFKSLKNDIENVELIILEYTDDISVITTKWIKHYRNKGYSFYKERYLIDYKVKCDLVNIKNNIQFLVYLENKNKDIIVLGYFSSKVDVDVWLNTNYPNGDITALIYKDNKNK